jgi:hypothetical protein
MLALNIYDDLKLRIGTPDDMREVMDLAIAAAKENALLTANQALLAQAVWPALNQNHGLVGCIGKQDGEIEGIVVLNIGTLFYSDEPCVEERVVFVKPEYRAAKGGRARKLCEFSRSVAEKLGLPLLIGVLSSEETKHKVELYRRVFGEPSGAFWVVGRKTGGHGVTDVPASAVGS